MPYTYSLRIEMRPSIRLPRTRLVFTEASVLYQLILLINETNAINPEIILKINDKSHTYYGFSYNVTRIYLDSYKFECVMPV